ncbi:two-component sensor histidine kinase [Calidifontibacter sp. DB0510]|uniref:Sensor-like histidine kinase SenX3 n=1 Tax=Metallococcus carri TaxID=1656884 RepID=A0A967B169_9MICO|nr:ATP-binding protein [Metallococcus carri]NHN55520.1 two-component sensor histidine kinase [Metallococcus carri]NOP38296.1 two-component sensor histidine kinase [Calidifontibacter sp. DB2511S]
MFVAIAALAGLACGLLVGWWLTRRGATSTGAETSSLAAEPVSPEVADVLDALRSVSVVVDASDRVVRSSPAATSLGIVRGTELVHDQVRLLVRQVRREQDLREVELEVARGPVGEGRLTLGVRVNPLSDDRVLVLIDDRSHSRRVEETRRDFVVNVSHELKTPVGGLTLLAEAMDDARDDPEAVHRFAGRMQSETARLARLVQEIVELSRLQVADTLDEPVLVDVDACVDDAAEHLRTVAEAARIQVIVTHASGGRPAEIWGDRNLVTTAVRNLIENAINYSGPGTRVTVTVQADGDLVAVVVKDQGHGIPAGELDRIFERFYRVDPARSRRTGGTGLGLAIVKHICANHGGEVSVWSEEGQGSTFTIRLPSARPDSSAVTAPVTPRKVVP